MVLSRARSSAVGALVVATAAGCSLRVGSGGPPNGLDPGSGLVFGTSACARIGSETKLTFGAGASSFAFAWDTDHYTVVFPDPSSGDMFAGRLAADGSPLGSLRVQQTPGRSDLPSLLKTAGGYLAAWQEGSAGSSVFACALGSDATPVGGCVTLATTQIEQPRPILAHAPGGNAALAYMDQFADGSNGVQVMTLDPASLHVLRSERLPSSGDAGWPCISGGDHSLGIVWRNAATQANGSASYDIPFASLDASSLQASTPASLRGASTTDATLPRMIPTSFGFLAAWEDMRASDNQIFMALVDPNGRKFAGGLVEESNSGDANWPNMVWTGGAAGVVYYQWRDSRPQIFMSFVNALGLRVGGLHDLQVSAGQTGTSKYPDVVWTGSEFGVMWVDTRNGAPELWFQRVACHP